MPLPGSLLWVTGLHHWLFLLLHFLVSTFSFNPPLIPCCVSFQLRCKYGNGGWSRRMKKTPNTGGNADFLRITSFQQNLSRLRKVDGFWLSAEKPRQKGPICPNAKKEEGSRKSLRACLGYSACLDSCAKQGHHTFPTQDKIVSGGNSKNPAILSMGSPALNMLDAVFLAISRPPSCSLSYPYCSTAFS